MMKSLFELFLIFFKIGLFTFGGGYAMIPMIIEETSSFEFIDENEIIDFIAISESTPGPFAVNIATFIGYEQNGILGAISATLGVILPSFIIILLLVNIIEKVKENRFFKSIIKTVMPLIIGLILATTVKISLTSLFNINELNNIKSDFTFNIVTCITFLIIGILYTVIKIFTKKKLAPIFIILISASLGILISYLLALVVF